MTQLAMNGALCLKEMGKYHTSLEFVTDSILILCPERSAAPGCQGLSSWDLCLFPGQSHTINNVCYQENQHGAYPQIKPVYVCKREREMIDGGEQGRMVWWSGGGGA